MKLRDGGAPIPRAGRGSGKGKSFERFARRGISVLRAGGARPQARRMSFPRCFSTLGCPEFSLAETFALARRHGLDAVELRALGGTIALPEYFAREFGSPAALAARVRGEKIRVAALDASLRLADATAAERAELLAFAPWAEALGAPRLRVFDGGHAGDAAEIAAMAATADWWRGERRARGWRCQLMVETHDALRTADRILAFAAAAPDVGVLWDTHHTWKKGGEDPVATWRAVRAHVVHAHVKDSVSVASEKHPFTYVPPGDGEFPMAPLVAALRADGFAGHVSLEWEKLWHPYLAPLDTALAVAGERAWW